MSPQARTTMLTQPTSLETAQPGRLELRSVAKDFVSKSGTFRAVAGVDLTIEPGEFVTLLGPSGCGKTTTLRMIAGFETPTAGTIWLDGEDMIRLTPDKRPMSMVFQSYALFPHLSVFENVAYGLRLRRTPAAQLREEVELVLTSMNLTSLAGRAPNQLSGGQQQRVALARALVMKPKVLLFDEPLSNLDAKLRVQMRAEIRRLQQRLGITSLYVTHDQDEAMSLSDRIVVMNAGRIEQAGRPSEIYRHPASAFVADFIGRANFIDAGLISTEDGWATVRALRRELRVPSHPDAASSPACVLLLRPESVRVVPDDDAGTAVQGDRGRVLSTTFYGQNLEYEVETESGTVVALIPDPAESDLLPVGAPVRITFDAARAWLLPQQQ